jgi:hypothetical protein
LEHVNNSRYNNTNPVRVPGDTETCKKQQIQHHPQVRVLEILEHVNNTRYNNTNPSESSWKY